MTEHQQQEVKQQLSRLNIHHLAGKLIMGGFDGLQLSSSPRFTELLQTIGLGGVILFRRNVDTPSQLRELTWSIREANYCDPAASYQTAHQALPASHQASAAAAIAPPIIAVDQEGGKVARLRPPHFTQWPPMARLGATGDQGLAFRVGAAIAVELVSVGINMDFAPVADVNTNPDNPIINDRSFSSDPEMAGLMASAFARGLQSVGVASCMKHFPGHGDTWVDSHLELPVINHHLDRLRRLEFTPFRMGLQAGAASIMTAHILLPALDDRHPATLSKAVITGLLRQELGFDGVIVTDDLEMAAVAQRYSIEEMVTLGLDAGIDIFLICHNPELQLRAIEKLVKLVESGEVARSRLEESALRIEMMKLAHPGHSPLPHLGEKAVAPAGGEGWPEHSILAASF